MWNRFTDLAPLAGECPEVDSRGRVPTHLAGLHVRQGRTPHPHSQTGHTHTHPHPVPPNAHPEFTQRLQH